MASNVDNPMERLEGLKQRIKKRMEDMGLTMEHIAFTPSGGPGGQHMVQLVLRLEPSVLMGEQDGDVELSEDELAAFEALTSGASKVDSADIDRDKAIEEVQGWLEEEL